MTCRGICTRYKAKPLIHYKSDNKPKGSYGRYLNGQKRCQICELFIKWDGLNCPCCGSKLRVKPRPNSLKDIYRSLQKKKEEIKIVEK